jgi:hypothetical protein
MLLQAAVIECPADGSYTLGDGAAEKALLMFWLELVI